MSEETKLKVYLETSFVSYLTGRPTAQEPIATIPLAPIDEIYRIRQEISAQYGHDPEKLYLAMVSDQREQARKGQVFWGYNADGVLAPLQ